MHHRVCAVAVVVLCLLAVVAVVPPASAGTQDFALVNQTGVEIYSLYISESANNDWEEDVLGDKVLPDGQRMNISFSGRAACLWDMMVTDDEGSSVTWTGINLCETSVVVLRCNEEGCWAETE